MKKNSFWKNKKILITGIDGFVGSNLAKRLISKGANVSGIIQKKKNSLLYHEKISKFCKLYMGQIYDNNFIKKVVKKKNLSFYFI